MASFATVALPMIAGQYLSAQGAKAAGKAGLVGAQQQIKTQRQGTEFAMERLGQQIKRQQPFLDIGKQSLANLVSASRGEGEPVTDLPSTQIQRDIITDFLGETAPQNVLDETMQNLEATETEKRKQRLSNLVNVGLGATGATADTGAGISTAGTRGVIGEAGITGQSLMQQAMQRQNQQQNVLGALSQLPMLYAATRGGTPGVTPNVVQQPSLTGVPLGTSAGYGGYA